jgi:hypothetical protein
MKFMGGRRQLEMKFAGGGDDGGSCERSVTGPLRPSVGVPFAENVQIDCLSLSYLVGKAEFVYHRNFHRLQGLFSP